MKATISIKEMAETVADAYGIHAKEIIKSRFLHKEARQILIEINYLVNFRKKTLIEVGKGLTRNQCRTNQPSSQTGSNEN